jgi:hypothetical protein
VPRGFAAFLLDSRQIFAGRLNKNVSLAVTFGLAAKTR